jgi:transcriptional regulator with XRE-family HTH domain
MSLADYLRKNNLSPSEFASLCGVKNAETVRKWLRGDRIPRAEMMQRIIKASSGHVSPSSFYGRAR